VGPVGTRAFRAQAALAVELGRALVVHARLVTRPNEALCLGVLRELVPREHPVHMHCYSDSLQHAQSSDSLVRVPASERELAGPTWSQYLLRPIRLVRALASPTAPEGLRYCAMVERAREHGLTASSAREAQRAR